VHEQNSRIMLKIRAVDRKALFLCKNDVHK
jgi:hypothetical protein